MFLDVGIGIFTAIIASELFNIDINYFLLFFSIFFSLIPDFDFLYFYPKREDSKYDYKHRDYIHYPLIYLPLGSVVIFIIFGELYVFTFLLSSFLHFVHDSIGIGWGIKWLYPFSKKSFAFFCLYSKKNKKGLRKLIFSFDESDLVKYVREHGDPNWVKNIYLKWHPIAIIELLFFVFAILILILYVS